MQRSGKAHHKDAILTEIIISLGILPNLELGRTKVIFSVKILPNLELGRTKVIFSVSSQEIFCGYGMARCTSRNC